MPSLQLSLHATCAACSKSKKVLSGNNKAPLKAHKLKAADKPKSADKPNKDAKPKGPEPKKEKKKNGGSSSSRQFSAVEFCQEASLQK